MSSHYNNNNNDIEKNNARPQHIERRASGRGYAPPAIASPAPLGLFSFASTTLILSLFNAQARGISEPNAVVGMALFCGGLAQLLAGMWEFPKGNTFGATAFTSYGAFWLSWGIMHIPASGIRAAYADETMYLNAVGIYLITWTLVTFFFMIAALRKTNAFVVLFGLLTITFALLAGGDLAQNINATKAGGIFGVLTALVAYYIGLSDMLANEAAPVVRLPVGAYVARMA
ncbi:FUN34 transmembrane protein [Pterulicium gracile]|uniref:FUN34 transmembrane protein n=1 Tax=Pterulicium gracile TaxID=1884261 RepID=A0A5C3QE35_9AGAR|nr:FUN34 transmembrane protein [Pterula gracilis]